MNRRMLTTILAVLAGASVVKADNIINIRVSVKVILNPADGRRPTTTQMPGGPEIQDWMIDDMIEGMDPLISDEWRGFRFVRVDPITEIGATQAVPYTPSRPDPSFYSSTTSGSI